VLSYPLIWSMRVAQMLVGAALFAAGAGLVLWLIPVDLETPWVPRSEQLFYILGAGSALMLLRWAVEVARRRQSPVRSPLVGRAPESYWIASLIVAAVVSVPFVVGYAQRARIVRASAEMPVVEFHYRLNDLARACVDHLKKVCTDDLRGIDTRLWPAHPLCETRWAWSRLARISFDSEEIYELWVEPGGDEILFPRGHVVTVEHVEAYLKQFIHDAGLDAYGHHAARLAEFRQNFASAEPFRICGEGMRVLEPLQNSMANRYMRTMEFAAEIHGTIAPNRDGLHGCALLATYVALALSALAITLRKVLGATLIALVGFWTAIALFLPLFQRGLGQSQMVTMVLGCWVGGIIAAACASLWRGTWRLAAGLALASLVVTPVVPMLAAWAAYEWDFSDRLFPGGIFEVLRGFLTEETRWRGNSSEVLSAAGRSIAGGWLLTGILLIPYQWLAMRAASLPARDDSGA